MGDPPLDQVLDAGQHVPGVADAQVADVQRPELLAVSSRAAIVRHQDDGALRQPLHDRIHVAAHQLRPGYGRGAPVDDDHQGTRPSRLVPLRPEEHALDLGPVPARPPDHVSSAQRPARDLFGEVGHAPWLKVIGGCAVDLIHRRGTRRIVRHRPAGGGDVGPPDDPGLATPGINRAAIGIEAEDAPLRTLVGDEPDAVVGPREGIWILVEVAGQNLDRSAGGRDPGQLLVAIECRILKRRREQHPAPVRRPDRIAVDAGLCDDPLHLTRLDIHQ